MHVLAAGAPALHTDRAILRTSGQWRIQHFISGFKFNSQIINLPGYGPVTLVVLSLWGYTMYDNFVSINSVCLLGHATASGP